MMEQQRSASANCKKGDLGRLIISLAMLNVSVISFSFRLIQTVVTKALNMYIYVLTFSLHLANEYCPKYICNLVSLILNKLKLTSFRINVDLWKACPDATGMFYSCLRRIIYYTRWDVFLYYINTRALRFLSPKKRKVKVVEKDIPEASLEQNPVAIEEEPQLEHTKLCQTENVTSENEPIQYVEEGRYEENAGLPSCEKQLTQQICDSTPIKKETDQADLTSSLPNIEALGRDALVTNPELQQSELELAQETVVSEPEIERSVEVKDNSSLGTAQLVADEERLNDSFTPNLETQMDSKLEELETPEALGEDNYDSTPNIQPEVKEQSISDGLSRGQSSEQEQTNSEVVPILHSTSTIATHCSENQDLQMPQEQVAQRVDKAQTMEHEFETENEEEQSCPEELNTSLVEVEQTNSQSSEIHPEISKLESGELLQANVSECKMPEKADDAYNCDKSTISLHESDNSERPEVESTEAARSHLTHMSASPQDRPCTHLTSDVLQTIEHESYTETSPQQDSVTSYSTGRRSSLPTVSNLNLQISSVQGFFQQINAPTDEENFQAGGIITFPFSESPTTLCRSRSVASLQSEFKPDLLQELSVPKLPEASSANQSCFSSTEKCQQLSSDKEEASFLQSESYMVNSTLYRPHDLVSTSSLDTSSQFAKVVTDFRAQSEADVHESVRQTTINPEGVKVHDGSRVNIILTIQKDSYSESVDFKLNDVPPQIVGLMGTRLGQKNEDIGNEDIENSSLKDQSPVDETESSNADLTSALTKNEVKNLTHEEKPQEPASGANCSESRGKKRRKKSKHAKKRLAAESEPVVPNPEKEMVTETTVTEVLLPEKTQPLTPGRTMPSPVPLVRRLFSIVPATNNSAVTELYETAYQVNDTSYNSTISSQSKKSGKAFHYVLDVTDDLATFKFFCMLGQAELLQSGKMSTSDSSNANLNISELKKDDILFKLTSSDSSKTFVLSEYFSEFVHTTQAEPITWEHYTTYAFYLNSERTEGELPLLILIVSRDKSHVIVYFPSARIKLSLEHSTSHDVYSPTDKVDDQLDSVLHNHRKGTRAGEPDCDLFLFPDNLLKAQMNHLPESVHEFVSCSMGPPCVLANRDIDEND